MDIEDQHSHPSGSGQVRYRLGERLVDRYLEFVAGRCRPNTLRAVAFELKAFFAVTGKDPVAVTAADVFEFLAHQRGDRTVVRLAWRIAADGVEYFRIQRVTVARYAYRGNKIPSPWPPANPA